eukprot:jgi/Botrbrau1/18065/Bobra.0062s0051.1
MTNQARLASQGGAGPGADIRYILLNKVHARYRGCAYSLEGTCMRWNMRTCAYASTQTVTTRTPGWEDMEGGAGMVQPRKG